jgi:hypothetical protein
MSIDQNMEQLHVPQPKTCLERNSSELGIHDAEVLVILPDKSFVRLKFDCKPEALHCSVQLRQLSIEHSGRVIDAITMFIQCNVYGFSAAVEYSC